MYDGKNFVPHPRILRAKYEYQKINRIFKVRTSTDWRTQGMEDRSYIDGLEFQRNTCGTHIYGIDFVAEPSDEEISITVRSSKEDIELSHEAISSTKIYFMMMNHIMLRYITKAEHFFLYIFYFHFLFRYTTKLLT
ncbi:hypothetical protein P5V15_010664 [Pogonomyrmex californicus]